MKLQSIRPLRLFLVAALVVTGSGMLLSQAHAAPITLISNMSATTSYGLGSGDYMAAGFTTHPTDVYWATSADLQLGSVVLTSTLSAWIYSDNAGNPGSPLAAFTPIDIPEIPSYPQNFVITLTAPYQLAANTTYWLVFNIVFGGMTWSAVNTPPTGIFTDAGFRYHTRGAWQVASRIHKWALNGKPDAPEVSLNASSLDFGDQASGTTSATQTVTITNTGFEGLILGALIPSGEFALPPADDHCSGQTVAASGTCTFGVTFSPTSVGTKTGSVSIPSNAASALDVVNLSGNGILHTLSLDTTLLAFGDQLVGTMSASQTVTVTNTGTVNLTISNLGTSSDFGVMSYGCTDGSIPPEGACSIDVAFFPSSVGPKTGLLTITSDATSSPDTVDLTGNGVAGEVGLTPSALNFGDQLVQLTSAVRTVTLRNTGGADLHLGTLSITGQFALDSNTCNNATLIPDGTCTFGVTFTPLTVGAKTGEVSIPSDAGGVVQQDRGALTYPHLDTLPLSGNGAYPVLGLSTKTINFGDQQVGTTSAARAVTLTNTGLVDLHVDVLAVTGQFGLAANLCNNATLLPASTCTFSVTFSPLSAGAKTGTVTIPSNAASSPDTVSLSGNGIASHTTLTIVSNGANDGTLRESAKDSGICNFIENPRSPLISVGDDSLKRQLVSILDFDTSRLPDNAVITGVKLSVKAMILQSQTYLKLGELSADVTKPFFGTFARLEYKDFEVRPLARNVGTFTHAPMYYNWISMNMKPASLFAVNKTGHTQFRLHFQKDYSDDLIKHMLRFFSGNFWIPADWPKLVISYYIP